MKEVTSMLENKLGPDTGDLCMRFGLHSGPVTAGVLRGDRARFQLFGDTVNTAARMESTGQRGKIHVSLNTHDLLVEAGKAHWLKPRADAVHAKGKGNLKTFWLDPSSKKGSNGGSSNTDPSESRTSLNNEEAAAFASRPALSPAVVSKKDHQSTMKQDRLVNWIVDMLHEHIRKLVALRKTHSTDHAVPFERDDRKVPLDEVAEVIYLPRFDGVASSNAQDYRAVHIDPEVMTQLKELVATIASWYR